MTNYGIFTDQPDVLLLNVLDRIPYDELVALAQTSKTWFLIVRDYVTSVQFQKEAFESKQFYDLGLLIGIVSESNEHKFIENVLESLWNKEHKCGSIGEVTKGFCSYGMTKSEFGKLFDFIWNLVGNFDDLLGRVIEELPYDMGDIDEANNVSLVFGKGRKLRRQLDELFLSDNNSKTYGYFFVEIMKKVRVIVDDKEDGLDQFLQIVLSPMNANGDIDFINMRFIENDFENLVDLKMLAPIAKAFKAIQTTRMSSEENEFWIELFNSFIKHWIDDEKAGLFSLEPCLPSWFLYEHSYFAAMGFDVANILLKMTLIMRDEESEKFDDLKATLSLVKNRFGNKGSGVNFLSMIRKKLDRARRLFLGNGTEIKHPCILYNKFTNSLQDLVD